MIIKKEKLLKEIEVLLSYNPQKSVDINPNYIEYLELNDLESIKANLINKVGTIKQEDIVWLEQFKKYE
ncbi:MAG: hypothetical protein DSZ07_06980 [Sulfurovum sp.]|nr:MAG: hypothetical protein DSZ07_06980 [Sulfurovum sp.]